MTCWNGPASPFETRLLQPMATYALEQLRQRFLFALTTTHEDVKAARALLQMAFETEVGVILVKMMTPPAGLAEANVCERRHFIDIDQDIHLQRYLVGPAMDDLARTPHMPEAYVDFISRYLTSDYPRYRMCALAVAICMGKVLQ